MTRTGRSPRLSGHRPEPFVDVHPKDAARAGLDDGGLAALENERGRMIARVRVTLDVREGEAFAPMHWNAQFASLGRVNPLVAPEVDPVSGQPELKHGVVRLERHAPARHGFILSRDLLELTGCEYTARAKLRGCWRTEFADDASPSSWPDWARAVLGTDGEWIELCDPGGRRYRAAVLERRRLKACVFASAEPIGTGREWLAALFEQPEISEAMRPSLLAGGANRRGAGPASIVCSCFSVGRDALVDAIRTQALTTAADIGRMLGAGTSCGSCVPELNALLEAERRAI
jgi:assimilatory nitrate reductase catalytic subunit